ncbi:hypothetical protein GCM10027429_19580 [Marivirga atlantica]|jgi:hypothetical protein|uniref:SusF/SusE family outer membrane protein n=1 Tax=Marivirga atlantica TaxID=1548457 RepID=A0A937DJ29_9BACT|nr:hypothetical protein [Marivirga atlantica]MBL0765575.1 hypothetical protein [Marivirga atlantica]
MKNFKKLWAVALMLAASFAMVSCDEDEPIVEVQEGLNVADGYYFVVEGEDPVAERSLTPEQVEGDGFAAVDRDGFYGNYVFLEAGDYQLQKVEAKEVSLTLGGALSTVPLDSLSDEEPFNSYDLALLTEDGAAINIANDGFYKVSYDETTSELIVMEVEKVSFIGAPSGWSDVEMTTVSSNPDDGFVFNAQGVTIREGDNYKIRINNAWKIIRNNDAGDGYVAFTNYGGSADNLVAGGGDIPFAQEDGVYTVEVELQNDGGAFLNFNRTGDAEEITFDPDDYNWGVIGSVTANGYDADRNLVYAGVDGDVYSWVGVVWFADANLDPNDTGDRRFKFRNNDDWTVNLGGAITPDGTQATLAVGGGDIVAPASGAYYIVLSTADEGETWNATMIDTGWSLIGAGSPSGDWNVDTALEVVGNDNGTVSFSYTGAFVGGEFKVRAGGDWKLNYGGSIDALEYNSGTNLTLDAGTYEFVLSFDGETYTASATAQ